MTGNQLKVLIDIFQLGNYEIAVGCKGYTSSDEINNGLGVISVDMADGKILIHDGYTYNYDKED